MPLPSLSDAMLVGYAYLLIDPLNAGWWLPDQMQKEFAGREMARAIEFVRQTKLDYLAHTDESGIVYAGQLGPILRSLGKSPTTEELEGLKQEHGEELDFPKFLEVMWAFNDLVLS